MSEPAALAHGIAPGALAEIRALCERTPGVERLWLFGSRAQGTHRDRSDIDLAVDAPGWTAKQAAAFTAALKQLPLVYPLDAVWWQDQIGDVFRAEIASHRVVLWQPAALAQRANARSPGVEFKPFQERVLSQLNAYLAELQPAAKTADAQAQVLEAMEEAPDTELLRRLKDYPATAWKKLREKALLPDSSRERPHNSRWDGAGRAIPNVCLKVPTGGGKTLLATAAVGQVFSQWFKRHTGLVLWVVPNEAIYQQTLKTLSDRDHPYRQLLNVAGAGRVKVLEKHSPLTRQDVDSHLCVMVLMLASAARQSKETLRFFRDRGNVLGFVPREDDLPAHHELLLRVPNLDAYAPFGTSQAEVRAQMGSIVKSSLGNVARLLRPMVVIDEGHHGYTENALKTLDGFNPGFLLELSATPRVASAKGSGSNVLVDVRGTDLQDAQMIKLPIHVDVQHWSDWQACLAASVERLDALQREAEALRGETARYIRPILLVQVERTGADTLDTGFIHAEHAKAYLLQLGFTERQIAVKTSEQNDLSAPENIDLLSPLCEVRAIITKQALQEGWDCPFAYVLCALAAGRNPGAMTQLVGRILRQPQAAYTGREALDACYVLCHDAKTAEVVKAIRSSLEGEGMGDLALRVSGGGSDTAERSTVRQQRREAFRRLRIFVPRVTWAEPGKPRRELAYDSDVLDGLDWSAANVAGWVAGWAPNPETALAERFDVSLDILQRHGLKQGPRALDAGAATLDRGRLVRALLDLMPNAWLLWDWVNEWVAALRGRGLTEAELAGSSASLIEHLRQALEARRDELAEGRFAALVAQGRIEFALRADAQDYELPQEAELALGSAAPQALLNAAGLPALKSLLEPALVTGDLNGLEADCAGYLDAKAAVHWWHRNVARTQYGLQGWKRHKVYPDFVFGLTQQGKGQRLLLLETKGAHLQGNEDTGYKARLFARLEAAFADARWQSVGELALADAEDKTLLNCKLLMDSAWQGGLEHLLAADSAAA
ncbi:DEAD/DEAH box helicase family protein [Roseateles sp.]|uniref:DEAD/DEAH box helicase family protein n=1 Tax=Roseateles sp. TaxID=1971397 RepID=UPI00395D52E2